MKMKFVSPIITFLMVFLFANGAFAAPMPGGPFCDSTLWAHVYHSYRLVVDSPCMSVTGTIDQAPYTEADGDYHIRLKLDTQFNYMLNSLNISDEYGDLVVEPICAAAITQSDAVAPCEGLTNTVYIPTQGEYVKVTGPYVTDNDHGWNEIHPITSIEIVSPTAVGSVSAEDITIKTYPNPADDFVNFTLSTYPDAPVQIILSDAIGRSAGQYQMQNSLKLMVNVDWWPVGMYYYTIMQKGKVIKTGSFAVAHK